MLRRPPRSTPFPSTTLFRSDATSNAAYTPYYYTNASLGFTSGTAGLNHDLDYIYGNNQYHLFEIGRAHVSTPATPESRMPSSACSKNNYYYGTRADNGTYGY